MKNFGNLILKAQSTENKQELFDIMLNHLGYVDISKSQRKKSLEFLRGKVINMLEDEQIEQESSPEQMELRESIDLLQQQYEGKMNSYHSARNPQKVLDQAGDLARQIGQLEEELESLS